MRPARNARTTILSYLSQSMKPNTTIKTLLGACLLAGTAVSANAQMLINGGGQKQILAETVDFGASDGPMSDENLAKAPGKILHIPTVAGADVLTYNLPGNP